MKIKRIIALVLALSMLPIALASCSKKVKATVKVSIAYEDRAKYANGYIILDKEVTVEGTTDDPPTVMKATILALEELEKSYDKNDRMFTSFDGISEYKEADPEKPGNNIEHFWEFKVNDQKPANGAGTANTYPIYKDDSILYYFTEESRADRSNEGGESQAANKASSTTAASTTKKK